MELEIYFDELAELTKDEIRKELQYSRDIPLQFLRELKSEIIPLYNELKEYEKKLNEANTEKENDEIRLIMLSIKADIFVKIDVFLIEKEDFLIQKLKKLGKNILKASFSVGLKIFMNSVIK